MRRSACILAASLVLAACGRPDPTPRSPAAETSPAVPAVPVTAAAPATPALPLPIAEPEPEPVPAPVAEAPPGLDPDDPIVLELRNTFRGKRFTLTASGAVELNRGGVVLIVPPRYGKVPAASVEALRRALLAAKFCGLAPKRQESAKSYTTIVANLPGVACEVTLPDKRWDKLPAAKRVLQATRKLETEAFPQP